MSAIDRLHETDATDTPARDSFSGRDAARIWIAATLLLWALLAAPFFLV